MTPRRRPTPNLSPRELEILVKVANGWTDRAIGAIMSLADRTLGHYRTSIYDKLGATNASHAVTIAFSRGILRTEGVTAFANTPPPPSPS